MSLFIPGLLAALSAGLAVAVAALLSAHRRLRQQTERAEQAEAVSQQTRRLAELGTLTGVLAHEIKNPLSTVGLNLQLLQEDLDPHNGVHDRFRGRLSVVQRETARLRDILDDFLRYAGKLELDRRPTDVHKLLEELVDFFTPQAQLARVQLRLGLSPTPPAIADVDAKAIKQAVLNLMINAVQAMTDHKSGGELLLSVAQDRAQAVVTITDTGPGISPEALDKIFQAYYSTKRGGTGLGLAMARRIADEHGGSLTVQSELGKGTQFSLRLPLSNVNRHEGTKAQRHEG